MKKRYWNIFIVLFIVSFLTGGIQEIEKDVITT